MKAAPKKIENTFESQVKQSEEENQPVKAAEPVKKEDDSDFKKNLAAMLARGQLGSVKQAPKKPEPVEEVKEKIKLNVFEDEDGDEATQMQKLIEKQQNLASEETEAKMGILPLA